MLSGFLLCHAGRQNSSGYIVYNNSIHGRYPCHWQGTPRRVYRRATNVTKPNTRSYTNWSSSTIRHSKPRWKTKGEACLSTFNKSSTISSNVAAWSTVFCEYAVGIAIMSANKRLSYAKPLSIIYPRRKAVGRFGLRTQLVNI